MKKIAIFASGSGTNAENIVEYFRRETIAEVTVVLSNRPTAGVHERMKRLNVPSLTFSKADFLSGEPIVETLRNYEIDLIVLAGFMNKISEPLLKVYPNQIINIHPALLPKYGGKGMYGMHVHEAVVAAKEKETGITIHYVNEHYDEGTIIFQASCPVLPKETPEMVAQHVHAIEYTYYPKVIKQLLMDK